MKFRKIFGTIIGATVASATIAAVASAETFGVGFQTNTWMFRDNYGQDICVFWDETWYEEEGDPGEYESGYVAEEFSFQNAEVTEDGTYTVSVSGIPEDNYSKTNPNTGFNFIKLTSSVDCEVYKNLRITIDKVVIGGEEYTEAAGVVHDLDESTDNLKISVENVESREYSNKHTLPETLKNRAIVNIINAYGEGLIDSGSAEFGTDIEVTFTVEGLDADSVDYEYEELPDGTIEITKYIGDDTEVEIPSEIDGKAVTSIGKNAFRFRTEMTSVTLPESITRIGEYAFYNCLSLTSLTLPDGITSIDGSVFSGCSALTTIAIPESVTNIGSFNFSGCYSLESINVDNNNKYYASENGVLFNKDKTTLISFPNGKFDTKYVIPGSVELILEGAFASSSKLESVTIPDSVTEIGRNAFWNCESLKSLSIPESVISIGDLAINYYLDTESGLPTKHHADFMITCYEDSAAHEYATNNKINFTLLSKVTAPTAMKGFKLGGRANNALRLNWTKNTSADGYIIEQYNGSKWVRIAKITSNATTTYRVTGLKAGTAYKFRMRAYAMDGSKALYSAYTSTLAARTNPSNITGYKLGGRAADALRLNWTKNTSADGYIVEQYKSGKWVRIAKITSNATTTYKISGLKASTQYKFRVKAYKMSGKTALYSGYTSTLSAYTNPSKVTNLKITGKATTALRLGWSKNTSADGYIIEMYKDGKWVRAAKITSNATVTFRKSGLKKGTTYKFRVRTYNMVGKTALYGNYVSVSGTTNK